MAMKLSGKSILIIDDDAALLRAMSKLLTGEGADVAGASWAGEAIDHLTAGLRRFDLIITDLRMPILDGETILGAVSVAMPHAKVIVVTAFGTPEVEEACLRRGAAAFLEKPVDAARLLAAVQEAFAGGRPARAGGGRA